MVFSVSLVATRFHWAPHAHTSLFLHTWYTICNLVYWIHVWRLNAGCYVCCRYCNSIQKGKKPSMQRLYSWVSEAQAAAFLSQINKDLVFLIFVDLISFTTLPWYESTPTDHTLCFKYQLACCIGQHLIILKYSLLCLFVLYDFILYIHLVIFSPHHSVRISC